MLERVGDVAEDALLKTIAVAPLPRVEGHTVRPVRVVLLDDDPYSPGAVVPGLIPGWRFFGAERRKRPIARGGVEQGAQAALLHLDLDGGFALGQVELLAF